MPWRVKTYLFVVGEYLAYETEHKIVLLEPENEEEKSLLLEIKRTLEEKGRIEVLDDRFGPIIEELRKDGLVERNDLNTLGGGNT